MQSFCQNPIDFAKYGDIRTEKGILTTANCKQVPNSSKLQVFFKNINDINQALVYIGQECKVDRSQLPPCDDEVYFADLIGCALVNLQDTHLGVCTAFANYGAGDILIYQDLKNQEEMIPYQDFVIKKIDLATKIIQIDDSVL